MPCQLRRERAVCITAGRDSRAQRWEPKDSQWRIVCTAGIQNPSCRIRPESKKCHWLRKRHRPRRHHQLPPRIRWLCWLPGKRVLGSMRGARAGIRLEAWKIVCFNTILHVSVATASANDTTFVYMHILNVLQLINCQLLTTISSIDTDRKTYRALSLSFKSTLPRLRNRSSHSFSLICRCSIRFARTVLQTVTTLCIARAQPQRLIIVPCVGVRSSHHRILLASSPESSVLIVGAGPTI